MLRRRPLRPLPPEPTKPASTNSAQPPTTTNRTPKTLNNDREPRNLTTNQHTTDKNKSRCGYSNHALPAIGIVKCLRARPDTPNQTPHMTPHPIPHLTPLRLHQHESSTLAAILAPPLQHSTRANRLRHSSAPPCLATYLKALVGGNAFREICSLCLTMRSWA